MLSCWLSVKALWPRCLLVCVAGRVVDIYSKFDVIVSTSCLVIMMSVVCSVWRSSRGLSVIICAEPGSREDVQQPGCDGHSGPQTQIAVLWRSHEVQQTGNTGDHRGSHREGRGLSHTHTHTRTHTQPWNFFHIWYLIKQTETKQKPENFLWGLTEVDSCRYMNIILRYIEHV